MSNWFPDTIFFRFNTTLDITAGPCQWQIDNIVVEREYCVSQRRNNFQKDEKCKPTRWWAHKAFQICCTYYVFWLTETCIFSSNIAVFYQ